MYCPKICYLTRSFDYLESIETLDVVTGYNNNAYRSLQDFRSRRHLDGVVPLGLMFFYKIQFHV